MFSSTWLSFLKSKEEASNAFNNFSVGVRADDVLSEADKIIFDNGDEWQGGSSNATHIFSSTK